MSNFPITRTAWARLLIVLAMRAIPQQDEWYLAPLRIADARLKDLSEYYKVTRP